MIDAIDITGTVDTPAVTVRIDGTQIAGIDADSIPFPKGETGDVSIPTLDSGPIDVPALTMFKPGSVELNGYAVSGDAGQAALETAFSNRTKVTITVNIIPAGLVFEYPAYVKSFLPGSKDRKFRFSASLIAAWTLTKTTTYAGITSIEGAGAGIAYSPAVANTAFPTIAANATALDIEVANTVIFKVSASSDTVEVTAAASSYIGISYDNGANWTKLTSGTAAAIPTANYPAAGKVTKALIKVSETDKATRFVNLFIARA